MQSSVSTAQAEIGNLKETQLQSSTQITDALVKSNMAIVGALKDIKKVLSEQKQATTPENQK